MESPAFVPFTEQHRAALRQLFDLGVVVEIKATRTYVRGRNTYPIRELLRTLGFRWHPAQRTWSVFGRLHPQWLPRLVEAHHAHEAASQSQARPVEPTRAASLEMAERISRGEKARVV